MAHHVTLATSAEAWVRGSESDTWLAIVLEYTVQKKNQKKVK